MNYYIYPKGLNGKLLSEIIHFFEPDSSVCFIDDASVDSSLENLKDSIGETPVLVASKKHKEQLFRNCENAGIKNVIDGIKLFGLRNQEYLVRNLKNPAKAVGIYLGGFAMEKHMGTLDRELEMLNVEVFYIAVSARALEVNRERIGRNIAIIAWHDFLGEICNIGAFVSCNGGKVDRSVININLGHSLVHFPQMHHHYLGKEYYKALREGYLDTSDYFVVGNRIDEYMFLALQKKYNPHTKILRNANLGFDEINITKSRIMPNKVVISPKGRTADAHRIYELIEELTRERWLHIVLRFHPTETIKDIEEESLRRFGVRGNFSVDTSAKFETKLKNETLTIITDFSSIAYSFPLGYLRPAVIYGLEDEPSSEGFMFINEKLHLQARTPQEVLNTVHYIHDNIGSFQEGLRNYRDEVLYLSDNPSKDLALKMHELVENKR